MDAHFAASFQPNTSNAHAPGEWPAQIRSGRRGSASRLRTTRPARWPFCNRKAPIFQRPLHENLHANTQRGYSAFQVFFVAQKHNRRSIRAAILAFLDNTANKQVFLGVRPSALLPLASARRAIRTTTTGGISCLRGPSPAVTLSFTHVSSPLSLTSDYSRDKLNRRK